MRTPLTIIALCSFAAVASPASATAFGNDTPLSRSAGATDFGDGAPAGAIEHHAVWTFRCIELAELRRSVAEIAARLGALETRPNGKDPHAEAIASKAYSTMRET